MRRCSDRSHRSHAAFVGAVVVPAPGEYLPLQLPLPCYTQHTYIENFQIESISFAVLRCAAGRLNHNNRAKW